MNTDAMPMYVHEFEDGRPPVMARAYPNELLADFRRQFPTFGYETVPEKFARTRLEGARISTEGAARMGDTKEADEGQKVN